MKKKSSEFSPQKSNSTWERKKKTISQDQNSIP